MAWTNPKTWADGNLVTAADLNEQVRDNSQYLKSEVDSIVSYPGTNPPGMERIATATFAASTANMDMNNVFSSAYRDYLVKFQFAGPTNPTAIEFRLLNADGTSTNINWQKGEFIGGVAGGFTTFPTVTYTAGWPMASQGTGTPDGMTGQMYVYSPELAEQTKIHSEAGNAANDFYKVTYTSQGTLAQKTRQMYGIRFFGSSSVTVQGRITVYGFRD